MLDWSRVWRVFFGKFLEYRFEFFNDLEHILRVLLERGVYTVGNVKRDEAECVNVFFAKFKGPFVDFLVTFVFGFSELFGVGKLTEIHFQLGEIFHKRKDFTSVLFSILDFGLKFCQFVCGFLTKTGFIKRVLVSQEMDVLLFLFKRNSEFDFDQVIDGFYKLDTVVDGQVDAVERFEDLVPFLKCKEAFLRIDDFEELCSEFFVGFKEVFVL